MWWNEATIAIDLMKNLENDIFDQIRHNISEKIIYYEKYLFWYGTFMFAVLAIVTLLTIFTLIRILKALSILIVSLGKVKDTQNFNVHINTGSNDEFSKISHSINNLLDYTDKIIQEKEFLATTDLLTGVMNRRSFTAATQKEISRNTRYDTPCSIIFCDIDLFKAVNDEYGHAVGDMVIKTFANTLQNNLRTNDFIGRWGGEEFIIFTTETDLESAEKLAQKLRKKIMEISIEPVKQVTCSFGVAQRLDNESFEDLCERADKALYKAKDSGRNCVCISE
ncbi:MAG: GGDEF domain-containing protein [Sulfurimonas sp.]|jgi:diguanylate cyclase (GGDEF)-like protein|nr:GGDEF domain-containing protein [Sulfurimonas sp.]